MPSGPRHASIVAASFAAAPTQNVASAPQSASASHAAHSAAQELPCSSAAQAWQAATCLDAKMQAQCSTSGAGPEVIDVTPLPTVNAPPAPDAVAPFPAVVGVCWGGSRFGLHPNTGDTTSIDANAVASRCQESTSGSIGYPCLDSRCSRSSRPPSSVS